MRMPAYRVLVNTPAPQGSTGITTNVFPSMTLGCGAVAGNITSDNVGPLHLINIKRLAYVVRKPEEAFEMPLDYNAATYRRPPPRRPAIAIDRSVVAPPWSGTWLPARWRQPARRPGERRGVRLRLRAGETWRPIRPTWWIASWRRGGAPATVRLTGAAAPCQPSRTQPQAGGLRLRRRRARRHPREAQNLHRAQDDRHTVRPRPGRPL